MHRSIGLAFAGIALFALGASGQTAKQALNAQALQDLKKAHQLLNEANHDYHGHRARAAEEVHHALRELGHNHKPAAGPKAAPKSADTKEAQALSDSQLKQAQQLLQGSLTHLGTRHAKAHANVQAAITEINQAFASRQVTTPKK